MLDTDESLTPGLVVAPCYTGSEADSEELRALLGVNRISMPDKDTAFAVAPGLTTFTRMPRLTSSADKVRARVMSAALLAA